MNVRFGILIFLVAVVLAEPARASDFISLCVTTGKGAPVQIKKAKTGDQLAPLKSGDLIYKMYKTVGDSERSPTLAFREGKLTEIVPGMEELEKKRLVNCAGDEPKSAEYPMIARDDASDAQLIYDEFGIISDFFPL